MISRRTAGIAGLIAGALLALPAAAKERTVKWESEFCTHTARYDDAVYQAKDIIATHKFMDTGEGVSYAQAPIIFEPEALSRIDIPKYQAECERSLSQIRSLGLVDLPGIEEFRKAKSEAVRDTCNFDVTKMRGYRDPSALRSYQPSEAMCSRYIDALEGKTDLRAMWMEIAKENCKTHGNPKACLKERMAEGEGPDGDMHIRIFVTGFGWNNCSTHHTKVNTTDFDTMTGRLHAAFKKKFKVREQCSEP